MTLICPATDLTGKCGPSRFLPVAGHSDDARRSQVGLPRYIHVSLRAFCGSFFMS
jgi:hypothetical protein